MKLILCCAFLFLTSCASYVQSIHKQIDNENKRKKYQQYKQLQERDKRPIRNPVTLGHASSANHQRNLQPSIKRNYNSQGVRRYRANDLVDNGGDGSLWSGKNSESFLFVTNNLKRQGDIVIVEVQKQLKEQIQSELKRNYPDPVVKKKGTKGKKEEKPAEEKEEKATASTGEESPEKVYDKISTTVVEQVNQDYLLIRGRKEVMFKKYKRYFELQAIVSQKEIGSNDSIKSLKLLEPKINVLRY